MKRSSTLFLKVVVLLTALAVLALCGIGLPAGIMSDGTGYYRPILFGMYVPAIPFFFGLFQALKLLNLIDKNKAFSTDSIKTLKYIKYSAFLISGLYALGMPYIYYAAQLDDAPGVVLIGLVIVFASFVVGTFAAVLQKLIQNAVDIKEENDLTV
jgi:hypothetical protein